MKNYKNKIKKIKNITLNYMNIEDLICCNILDNPELPTQFISDSLESLKEAEEWLTEEYKID